MSERLQIEPAPVVIISRNYIPKDRGSANHATIIAGVRGTAGRIAVVQQEIDKMKNDLIEYSKMKLRKMMLASAVKERMQVRDGAGSNTWRVVTKFEEIGESWRDDGSMQNAEKLFNVTYQLFDNNPSLLTTIEVDFMSGNNLQYDGPQQGKKKGCILEIVEVQRRVLMRLINDRTARSHNHRLSISRTNVPREERFRKRRPGVFHISFVKGPAYSETKSANPVPPPSSTVAVVAKKQSRANKELQKEFEILKGVAKDMEVNIRDSARQQLVEKASRTVRAKQRAGRSTNSKTQAQKKKPKQVRKKKTVIPVEEKELSNYEKLRVKNVERNERMLATLGLKYGMAGKPKMAEVVKLVAADSDEDVVVYNDEDVVVYNDEDVVVYNDEDEEDEEGEETDEDLEEEDFDEGNTNLVDEATEVVEILSKREQGGKTMYRVRWDNGGISEAPSEAVQQDFPDVVDTFVYDMEMAKKPAASTASANKRPRVETQLQSAGQCTCVHTDPSTFVSEHDARYWDYGWTYHGKVCDKCGNCSRPVSNKKPSYKCVDALAAGCLEVRCSSCYVAMILDDDDNAVARRSTLYTHITF